MSEIENDIKKLDSSNQQLKQSIGLANEICDIQSKTLNCLNEQKIQIQKISDNINKTENNMKKANKIINKIMHIFSK